MQRLAALGRTLTDLARAREENNAGIGAGVVDRGGEGLAVRSDARIRSIDELAAIVVTTRAGTPIRLDSVAQVRLGQAMRQGSASENGREVVVGTAIMRIGENSRTVASAVRSAEHTSEPQSLMRISYAVFCLNTKNHT